MNTLTGKPLITAFVELNKQLEANAYKEITGGKGGKLGLTDIRPAYLPEQLLELFGPFGWGWGFDLMEMKTIDRQVKRNAGYEETEYVATCKIGAWFRFEADGVIHKSDYMIGTGGSDNTQIEWAEKGALTSAIGTAWFFAGYQLDVYKGLRSHKKVSGGTGQRPAATAQQPAAPPPKSAEQGATATGPDAEYQQRVKAALHTVYGADKKAALDKVEELTSFIPKGKEEKDRVKGIRDFSKIGGKRLEILAHNLEKLVPKSTIPEPTICAGCSGKDGYHDADCPTLAQQDDFWTGDRQPGEEG